MKVSSTSTAPVELLEGAGLHGESDAVEHEPGGLLSGADCPPEFVGGDAVLGVGDQPNGRKPLVEAERRVLEDRAELDGELLLAPLALPESAGGQVGVLDRPTARAHRTARPAQAGDELSADIEVGEVPDCLDEGGGG